ncbi:MAG: hypothetical protein J3K34DRAFT_248244 [Monoraphidium minutum]|nr:MAG: hypothetical protein J3K34DRAFT_248244 [Monoraphidium minutum]
MCTCSLQPHHTRFVTPRSPAPAACAARPRRPRHLPQTRAPASAARCFDCARPDLLVPFEARAAIGGRACTVQARSAACGRPRPSRRAGERVGFSPAGLAWPPSVALTLVLRQQPGLSMRWCFDSSRAFPRSQSTGAFGAGAAAGGGGAIRSETRGPPRPRRPVLSVRVRGRTRLPRCELPPRRWALLASCAPRRRPPFWGGSP